MVGSTAFLGCYGADIVGDATGGLAVARDHRVVSSGVTRQGWAVNAERPSLAKLVTTVTVRVRFRHTFS